MATSANPIFTGSSSYAKDFQNAISRAVSIASLPISQLTSEQATLSSQNDELKTIDQKVAAVQSSIDGIAEAIASSYDTTISNTDVLGATCGSGAIEGNYSILVADAGAYSTMMTKTWVAGSGPPHTYELWIGATKYSIAAADNSAANLASAINTNYGDQVRATVVNVGPVSAPDYRISLESVRLTPDLLDLRDGTTLAERQSAGKVAQYQVNQSGITVNSDSRSIPIADGVTIHILKADVTPVNLTVTRSTSALVDAMQTFSTAFNAAINELDAQRGLSTGPLQGSAVIGEISDALSRLVTYPSSGLVSGLKDLGLDLGADGKLTFDSYLLMAKDIDSGTGVTSFFGSALTGGFLKNAADALNSLGDPVAGRIKAAESTFQSRLTTLSSTIADKQTQIDELQERLLSQMAAADAMIASMEQTYSYVSNMFSAMRTASEQYK